jgi:formylmethanofuran dehydrogenase subunit B
MTGGRDLGGARQPFVNRAAIRSGHGRNANPRRFASRELLDDPTATNEFVAATEPRAHIRTKVAEPMKRLSIDMPVNLHRRFKRACTAAEKVMVAEVPAFIERRTAELEKS